MGEGRHEAQLTPGTRYVAVRAVGGSNARYRLRLSTGSIQDLPLNGGSVTGQTLAAGDWRYYRVQLPLAAPGSWNVSFTEQSGEVELFLRDTSPPGRGFYGDWNPIRDWYSDAKNQPPYPAALPRGTHSLVAPPLRPGHTYYLGFRAMSDAVFSVNSTTSGSVVAPPLVDFLGGSISTSLDPHGFALYRVDVPGEASRWRHTATHATEVVLHIEQGSLPRSDQSHWRTYWENTALSQPLTTNGWPWVPGQSYFLLITNSTDQVQLFSLTMDGRTPATEDEDADGLPDAWVLAQFGNSWSGGASDADGDGLTNLEEYQFHTDPQNPRTAGQFDGLQLSAGNSLELHFTAEIGQRYSIEGSTNLLTWIPIEVVTNSDGAFWLIQTTPNAPSRFYRAVLQP